MGSNIFFSVAVNYCFAYNTDTNLNNCNYHFVVFVYSYSFLVPIKKDKYVCGYKFSFSIRTLLQNKPAGKFQFPRSMGVFIYYVLFILQEFINHRSSRKKVIFYRSNLLHKHLAVTGTLACLFPKPPLCFFP